MIYRRIKYHISPEFAAEFIDYLNNEQRPIHIRSGATFIGQWINDTNTEIMCMWQYPSLKEYRKIDKRVRKEESKQKGKPERPLFLNYEEDFLTSTGTFNIPKQTVTVSGLITNRKQEILLVQTYWRSDTWELPGGEVDEGETLDRALLREIFEETGIQVKLTGVTGVYSNGSNVCIVFRGEYVAGNPTISDETRNVSFIKLDHSNIHEYIKRPKYKSRVLDAFKGNYVPFEAFKVRPYELLNRIEQNDER